MMKKDIEFNSDDVRVYRGTVNADDVDTDELLEFIDTSDLIERLESEGYTVTKDEE